MVVSSNKIIEICGPTPPNHIKANPNSNNYIFENDPSFAPINLYDFFGNGATVNSFRECEYYVDGGWEPFKTTIFDISKIAFVSIGVVFLIYKFFKLGFHKSFINKLAISSYGFNNAELYNICNEASINAGLENREFITKRDYEKAYEYILMGKEKKSNTLVMQLSTLFSLISCQQV